MNAEMTTTPNREPLESMKELTERIRYSERTIRRWIDKKGFPCLNPGGGEYRFRPSEVDEWMDRETERRRAAT